MAFRRSIIMAAFAMAALAGAATAQEPSHETPVPPKHRWSFAGPFGKFDQAQLQRGYKVFAEVCQQCHTADLLSFRNLGEKGGPFWNPKYPNPNDNPVVKSLAAEAQINDIDSDTGDVIQRPATVRVGTLSTL